MLLFGLLVAVLTPAPVPCQAAPSRMTCIAGGPTAIGDEKTSERTRHTTALDTFYVDTKLVSVADYRRCQRDGACPKVAARGPLDAPMKVSRFELAHRACTYLGKRLLTEAEWEKAAGAGAFSPTGLEWTHDFFTACIDGCRQACGSACTKDNPRGPCDGVGPCPGFVRRVVKGGEAHAGWRGQSGKPSAFRCASTTKHLAAWPPLFRTAPLEPPKKLSPPSAAELKAFQAVVEDTDIFQIPLCSRDGKATVSCRDPMSYVLSNEPHQHAWRPALNNLGGGYMGVGADQNYTFITAAKSEWVWLFDYDPVVVRVHQILFAVLQNAATRAELVDAFMNKNRARTRTWIEEKYASLPKEERDAVLDVFERVRLRLWNDYASQKKAESWRRGFGWLSSDDNYEHMRSLVLLGRIQALKGNMLTDKAMQSIAQSARALSVPIRVYYASNAEEQWLDLPEQYRKNVQALPFDETSIILRTLISKNYHPSTTSRWHYVVHGGLHAQQRIGRAGYKNVRRFMQDRMLFEDELVTDEAGKQSRKPQALADHGPDYLSYIGMTSAAGAPGT